jgi:hypothetical protein
MGKESRLKDGFRRSFYPLKTPPEHKTFSPHGKFAVVLLLFRALQIASRRSQMKKHEPGRFAWIRA